MTLHQFLAILRARLGLALTILGVTMGCAIGAALLMPKTYTATAALLLDPSKPDPLAAAVTWSAPSPAYLSTQIDVIRSERVALEVVKRLQLAEQPELQEKWHKTTHGQGDINVWLARDLLKAVDVTPTRDSNVVSIAADATSPAAAAAVANAFARAYLDVAVQLRVEPARQYSSFFDAQARSLRANLEHAQATLSNFQRDKGIVVSDDRLDGEVSRLNELSAQLSMMQAVASESGNRQAMAQAGQGDRLQEVLVNPALAALRADLTHAEARLQELGARLGDNHPQVQETKASIASLRSRLESETRRVAGGVGVVNAINQQRQAELRGALEAQRARVMKLKSVRDEGLVLLRDVENAQRAYDGIQVRQSQANLESHATQSNAYLLTEASAPLLPSSPKLMVNTGLAAVIGLLLALGAVVLLELVDPRMRTADAALELLGVPLLGVLPGPGDKGDFAVRRTPLVMNRPLGRLTAPSQG